MILANAHVRMLPSGLVQLEARSADITKKITREVFRDIQRRVPVDTGELLDSLDMSVASLVGTITVSAEHWAAVEYGTKPHIIRSHGDYALRNRETGQSFGRTVHHPGTEAQPYMRPAVYKKRRIT